MWNADDFEASDLTRAKRSRAAKRTSDLTTLMATYLHPTNLEPALVSASDRVLSKARPPFENPRPCAHNWPRLTSGRAHTCMYSAVADATPSSTARRECRGKPRDSKLANTRCRRCCDRAPTAGHSLSALPSPPPHPTTLVVSAACASHRRVAPSSCCSL